MSLKPALLIAGFGGKIFTALIVFLFAFSSISYSQDSRGKWWLRHDEGWFFYKDPEKMTNDKIQNPKSEIQNPKGEPLASEIIKKEAERLLSRAITEPTEDNIKNYMQYQKKMLELADRFAVMWQRVLMKYPELYISVNTEGVNEEIQKAILELKKKAGLFFIYSSTCPHCQRASSVIKEFQKKYSFTVIPVSIDGGVLPEFPDTRYDNGISVRLGVQSVPSIFLAYPDEDRFEHIGTGLMSLPDLERRLYHYAITEDISYNYPNTYNN